MELSTVDWVVIVASLAVGLGIGLWPRSRAVGSTEDYFIAGRQLSWWLAGTSLVATSFAADTPLAIARIVRTQGLAGNWYWWCGVMAFSGCMFFFAPLWRRSRLMTDAEIISLRYGASARGLRVGLALYRGILVNGITMGWVVLGMQKITGEVFGWPKGWTIIALIVLTLAYSAASGLWGVIVTDLYQFTLAMIGSIALMIAVYHHVGGPAQLGTLAQAAATAQAGAGALPAGVVPLVGAERLLAAVPSFDAGSLSIFTFLFFIFVQWWGGVEGGGFLVQRLFATRDEQHAVFALLWFQIAHFALRTWPWIIVGLGSVIMFPQLTDPELAYPKVMLALLPKGLLGLMVASLLAAFMSTLSTHLNWGASYLVGDVLRRDTGIQRSERWYVGMSQALTMAMALLAGLFAWQMSSIYGAWLLVSELSAGAVLVGVLRWCWWRVNAWAEVAALATSLMVSNGLRLAPTLGSWLGASAGTEDLLARLAGDTFYPVRFAANLVLSTLVALLVMARTPPVDGGQLVRFHERVRPWGAWGPVTSGLAATATPVVGSQLGKRFVAWLLCCAVVYLALFGLGDLALGHWGRGGVLSLLCVTGLWWLVRTVRELEPSVGRQA